MRTQLAPFIARPVDRQHSIRDFTRLRHVLRPHGRNIDRQIRPQWLETQLETALKIEEFSVVDQPFAAQDHPDDLDILTCTLHRFLKGHAMPVFDHVCTRGAKPKDDAPSGTLIQRSHRAGYQGGSTRVNIGDACPNLDALRNPHQVAHGGKEFVAP